MANLVKKVIRKIRHKFKPPEKLEPRWKILMAQAQAEEHKREFWERDKANKRAENFKKALRALEAKREEKRIEQERQAGIAEQRLKNLKKARRKLAKIRSQDE